MNGMSNKQNENLIQVFTDEYFEKLYYFCLKKVSDKNEAEDLSAEIAMNIIKELRKGTVPDNISAWVWKIARNKYSQWADMKNKRVNTFSGNDIDILKITDNFNLDDDLIQQEDIKLLRRELAFISGEYRNVLVAYYVEFRSIKDISDSLNLPIGTVKSKLFRSRNILKEGINMAREFGMLSYNPEHINFLVNGNTGELGTPFSIINRNVCRNILIATYRTPSTAEELAMEIGVALPYMEDEISNLVWNGLLRQNGKKYETNFFIVSAKAQKSASEHLKLITSDLTDKIIALIDYRINCYEENGYQWHEGYQPYEDMKWVMLIEKVDEVHWGVIDEIKKSRNEEYAGRTKRPDGGEWDLLGFEERKKYEGEPAGVGMHGIQYKFNYKNIRDKTPNTLTVEQRAALTAVAKQNISEISQSLLDELTGFGYIEKTTDNCGYKPTFFVQFKDKIGELTAEQTKIYEGLYKEAHKIMINHYNFCKGIVYNEIPDFLKNDQRHIDFACNNISNERGAVLESALEKGYISYADNDERKMLGAYLIL